MGTRIGRPGNSRQKITFSRKHPRLASPLDDPRRFPPGPEGPGLLAADDETHDSRGVCRVDRTERRRVIALNPAPVAVHLV
jgi:hypothetical protein